MNFTELIGTLEKAQRKAERDAYSAPIRALDAERKAFIRQFVIHNLNTYGPGHLSPKECVSGAELAWDALQEAGC